MNREEKQQEITFLKETLTDNEVIYLADISNLNAGQSTNLRRICHQGNVRVRMVKNTLLKKAIEQVENKDLSEFSEVLKGNTTLMLAEQGSVPAKLIRQLRKNSDRPVLKAAYIEENIYLGDEQLETLANLKSKNELIADIILLLQSPAFNVVSGLKASASTLTGILKTLEENPESKDAGSEKDVA